jgi:hypothetical protein
VASQRDAPLDLVCGVDGLGDEVDSTRTSRTGDGVEIE